MRVVSGSTAWAVAAVVLLAGCVAKAPPEEARPPAPDAAVVGPTAVATLTTVYAGGVGKELHGYAYVPADDPGSLVVLVRGLKEGARAVHVHEAPSCRSSIAENKTVAAGEAGARWGDDLPDVAVDARGNGAFAAPFTQALAGRSLIVHALADAGVAGEEKAGPAVLCGVFETKAWPETVDVLSAPLGDGRVEVAPLFGAAYVRLAVRGLATGAYTLSGADRDACEGAAATAREPWTATPRLHAVDGALRSAWVVHGADVEALRGDPVLLQADRQGQPLACGILG